MSLAMAKETSAFLEALKEGADQLDRLNKAYPDLADDFTRETVETFRRTPNILQQSHKKEGNTGAGEQEFIEKPVINQKEQKLVETSRELLAIHSFDDVLDILQTEHNETLSLVQLVDLVGNNAYKKALRREAQEFQSNAISIPQIAQLWSDLGRPLIGDSNWTTASISMLLE